MPTFRYRPFYKYIGPTHAHPLLDELSEEEADRKIRFFFEDLQAAVEDKDGQVDIADGVASVTAAISEQECDELVVELLKRLLLFGKKL